MPLILWVQIVTVPCLDFDVCVCLCAALTRRLFGVGVDGFQGGAPNYYPNSFGCGSLCGHALHFMIAV
jgi:hypothetical protein